MNLTELTKEAADIGAELLGDMYEFASVSNSVISHSEGNLKEDFTATVYNQKWDAYSVTADKPELLPALLREKITVALQEAVSL